MVWMTTPLLNPWFWVMFIVKLTRVLESASSSTYLTYILSYIFISLDLDLIKLLTNSTYIIEEFIKPGVDFL